ncbi:MAG TPA: hypothetical protein VJM77_05585 [Nitrospiria bacterium]|nr:hypothetical protein [Nitrospiria bacterium]
MFYSKIFLATLILSGFILAGQRAEGVKPLVPLEIELELGGIPQVGGGVPVLLKVRSMMDAPMVKVLCILPEGVELISGPDSWEGELMAGSSKEMTITLKMGEPGKYLIRATATIEYPGGARMGKTAALLIDLEKEEKEKIKPEEKGPLIRKEKDGQDIGDFPLD